MTAKTKKILTILLVTLGITAFVITPLAWFANYWAQHSAGFNPGGNAMLPGVHMWMFQTKEEGSTNETGEWVSQSVTSGTDSFTLPGMSSTDITTTTAKVTNDGTETEITVYEFKNLPLHFGKVDNLISLQDDNIVYMRLDVSTAISGCNELTVNLDFNDPTPTTGFTIADLYDSVTLYGVDPSVSTNPDHIIHIDGTKLQDLIDFPALSTDATLADINSELCQFMQVSICVSTTEAIPGTPAFEALKFGNFDRVAHTEFDPIGGSGITVKLEDVMNSTTGELPDAATDEETETAADDTATPPETYYIYLKIAPRLEFFVLQENLLDKFVPSYLFFDTKLEIELH